VSELEDLRRLRYFVAVAEDASFTRAAQRLRVSQPALSAAIRQLERDLKVTLLVRDRPVAVTVAGGALLQDARLLLSAAARATARVRAIAAGDEGDIVTASTQCLTARFIPALLGRLGDRVPRPGIRHKIGSLPDVTTFVEGGIATVGFACYAPLVHGLCQSTLGQEPAVACLAAGHRLAGVARIGLEELARERWAIMDPAAAPGWYEVFIASCSAAGFEPDVAEFVTAADLSAAYLTFQRVAAGQLVTYGGASLVPAVTGFGIRCTPFDGSVPALPVDALWRPDDPLAESVLDTARAVCATNWWASPGARR
jgi:DNA-binding transcriptional LysR family regulator